MAQFVSITLPVTMHSVEIGVAELRGDEISIVINESVAKELTGVFLSGLAEKLILTPDYIPAIHASLADL